MRKVIIAFGLPGAGKTTFSKRFAREKNYSYVCPDSLVSQPIRGDIVAWQKSEREIVNHLQWGNDIIIEEARASLFTFRKYRIKWLREKGVKEIGGFYFPIDLALAKKENSKKTIKKKININYKFKMQNTNLQSFSQQLRNTNNSNNRTPNIQ